MWPSLENVWICRSSLVLLGFGATPRFLRADCRTVAANILFPTTSLVDGCLPWSMANDSRDISGLNSGPMVRTHSRDGAANSSRKSSISACQYVSMSSNLLKYWTSSKLITWIGCSQGTFQRRLQRPFAYQALGHTFCRVTGQPMYLAWELDTKVDQSLHCCRAWAFLHGRIRGWWGSSTSPQLKVHSLLACTMSYARV